MYHRIAHNYRIYFTAVPNFIEFALYGVLYNAICISNDRLIKLGQDVVQGKFCGGNSQAWKRIFTWLIEVNSLLLPRMAFSFRSRKCPQLLPGIITLPRLYLFSQTM